MPDLPGPKSWNIGDVTVTRITETINEMEAHMLLEGARTSDIAALPWLKPHFVTPDHRLVLSIHALVIEAPGRRIVVDTCIGNDKERLWPNISGLDGPFLQSMRRAGFAPETVDTVLCTHLHVDHVGWNTMLVDGEWVPTFPNARYLVERGELAYWQRGQDVFDGNGWNVVQEQAFDDSVAPLLAAGLIDPVDADHRICPQVRLVPTPGHSPGHVSVHIASQGMEAYITGDLCHHPCQLAHTGWSLDLDFDKAMARSTRERFLAGVEGRDVLVIGTHWAGPSAGYVRRSADGWTLAIA